MLQLFGETWDALTLRGVQEFLAGAEDEPLLWEAKGTSLSAHEVRRQCGAFANSVEGGYLILGARRTDDGWVADGVAFPDEEPHRSISDFLRDGVRPLPTYDVRAFAAAGGHVAVVRVEPLTGGPCIVRGTVYERVPGATIPVKDPARLAELFARGARAHEAARTAADRAVAAAAGAWAQEHADAPGTLVVSVAAAPVATAADIGARLFRHSTRELMHDLVEPHVRSGVPIPPTITPTVGQDRRVVVGVPFHTHQPSWLLAGFWDGSAAASARSEHTGAVQTIIDAVVAPAGELARQLAARLGGGASGYLTVTVTSDVTPHWAGGVTLRRGPAQLDDLPALLPSLRRELQRTVGIDEAEPEPGDP